MSPATSPDAVNPVTFMADRPTDQIHAAAGKVPIPGLGRELAACGARIEVTDGGARLIVTLGFAAEGIAGPLAAAIRAGIAEATGQDIAVELRREILAHAVQGTLTPLPNVRNVIAVASGKGGVGKSTTAVNLALALAAEGARVGVLDADIYGPSQPTMLGLGSRRPETLDGKTFEPLVSHGLQVMSIGFLVDEDRAVIWRGPMVTQALQQLMFQTNWRDLDYLVIDLPPGTGDAQLTLTQRVPLSGALIVTTPQDIALLDARRGLAMFEKVGVNVLGVVENMSTHVCPRCGHEEALFGAGGGDRLAAESGVAVLARLPLDIRIRQEADSGRPTVVAAPDSELAARYRELARRTGAELAATSRGRRTVFPGIVVEDR